MAWFLPDGQDRKPIVGLPVGVCVSLAGRAAPPPAVRRQPVLAVGSALPSYSPLIRSPLPEGMAEGRVRGGLPEGLRPSAQRGGKAAPTKTVMASRHCSPLLTESVYNLAQNVRMEIIVARVVLKRQNLMVDEAKVRQLRRVLGARSNSEAVRIAVDRELATTLGLNALQKLTERGTLEDVFNRAPAGRK